MSKDTLSALTRGIHHAAAGTSVMLAQQYVQMLAQFFDEREGKLFAKMTYLQLNDSHTVAVPLISLVAPRGLALERMKVSLSVRIDETELKQATIEGDNVETDRVSMKITVSPKVRNGERRASDLTDIEMEFTAGDPPEAMMRIIDGFANLVDPKRFADIEAVMEKWPPTKLTYSPQIEGDDGSEPPATGGDPGTGPGPQGGGTPPAAAGGQTQGGGASGGPAPSS